MGLNRDFYLNNISIKLKTVLYDKRDKPVYSKRAQQMNNCGEMLELTFGRSSKQGCLSLLL